MSDYLTLRQAKELLPFEVSVSTLWRWCRQGFGGFRLEYVRIGRRMCTTNESLDRFFARLAKLDDCIDRPSPARRTSRKRRSRAPDERQLALIEADIVLDEAGI